MYRTPKAGDTLIRFVTTYYETGVFGAGDGRAWDANWRKHSVAKQGAFLVYRQAWRLLRVIATDRLITIIDSVDDQVTAFRQIDRRYQA